MPRPKKSQFHLKAMCARFARLAEDCLQLSDTDLARRLGYANASTISAIRQGRTFFDVERLMALASLTVMKGRQPDLHWLITGEGEPTRRVSNGRMSVTKKELLERIAALDDKATVAALTLLWRR